MANVLIFVDQQGEKLSANARELLAFASNLANSIHCEVEALLVGSATEYTAKEAIFSGADIVYTLSPPPLSGYQNDQYLDAIVAAVEKSNADKLIISFDRLGKDILGRLATRIGASAITEVVEFKYDEGKIKWIRPIYGDKAYGEYTSTRSKVVVGIRPKSQDGAKPDETRTGEIIPLDFRSDDEINVKKLLDKILSSFSGIRLEDARIIVAGGRGLEGKEGFEELKKLSDVIGGTIGASRAACDAGWVPSNLQVGQTGVVVAPDLYIAVGISGASQHLAGITNAKTVVAINNDAEAAIFKRANIGILADYKTILPALTEELKKKLVNVN